MKILRTTRSSKEVTRTGTAGKVLNPKRPVAQEAPPNTPEREPETVKRFAFLKHGETGRVVVEVTRETSAEFTPVRLCLPTEDGIVLVTDQETLVPTQDLKAIGDDGVPFKETKVCHFDHSFEADTKAMQTVTDPATKRIVDYLDVTVEGHASTFKNRTPRDRDGDYIDDTAFNDTLVAFRRNPVMLIDHHNSAHQIAGSYTKLGTDDGGLSVVGAVSNAPDLVSIRFKLIERHLRAFSIGGLFFFADDDYHHVERITLFEISLVAVPANPDALFVAKSAITIEDVMREAKMLRMGGKNLTGITKSFA